MIMKRSKVQQTAKVNVETGAKGSQREGECPLLDF